MKRKRYPDLLALVANYQTQSHSNQKLSFPNQTQVSNLVFLLGYDPIACLNIAMVFMSTIVSSRFPSTNNQLRTSSNPRNQATIQDDRVTVQQVQGRQEKMLLVQAQESGQELDEEQLAFLADLRVPDDAYDFDCDDISSAKVVLMANLSSYDSGVLSEMSEQMSNHVTNWDKVNQETKTVNESLTVELERYKERVKNFEQRLNVDLSSREKLIDSQMDDMIRNRNALKQEIDSLKQTLSKQVKEKESLLQTIIVFKKESKEKENKYMDKEIDLENKIKKLDNIVYKVAQRIKPTLYDGILISKKHNAISMVDEEETLILEKESRSKMLAKQNDQISKEKKINISPIIYSELNKLSGDFGKCFVPQMSLSAKQAFWLPLSNPKSEQLNVTQTPVEIEVSKELPKWIFNQMEAAVKQRSVDKKYFDIQKKELSPDNDRLLDYIICQDVMNIMMLDASAPVNVLPAHNKCLVNNNLEIKRLEQENDHLFELLLSQNIVHILLNAELAKKEHMVEKNFFDEVVFRCSRLENRRTNLELKLQHQKESFLNNRSFNNQNAPEILENFKINEWQAKLDAKDVSIAKLKQHIENLKGKKVVEKDALPNNAKFIAP
ncbi:hypothetical protein Tco_1174360 [Tanacetum coccineum]